jgi:protein-tyrosine phosphatase
MTSGRTERDVEAGVELALRVARGARSVLFVCMGNICRSPLAEGVFVHLAQERGVRHQLTVDSCGTGGWHAGEPPDIRSRAVARRNGIELFGAARQVQPSSDFSRFDLLIPMDNANRDSLIESGAPCERTHLLRLYEPAVRAMSVMGRIPTRDLIVPDPYYGGESGFDDVFSMVHAACKGLLDAMFNAVPPPSRP